MGGGAWGARVAARYPVRTTERRGLSSASPVVDQPSSSLYERNRIWVLITANPQELAAV